MKLHKACIFVDESGGTESEGHFNSYSAYEYIESMLLMYISRFTFERSIRPFQLSYRPYHLYVCDIGGWDRILKYQFMESLGNIVRGRPSRVYLFWTGETFEAFEKVNSDLRGHSNCINACDANWMRQAEKLLLKMED